MSTPRPSTPRVPRAVPGGPGARWRRPLLALCLATALAASAPGCGSASDDDDSVRRGAMTLALPFVPSGAGELLTLGFKNPIDSAAPIWVTGFDPTGAPYAPAAALVVPAQGELHVPLASVLGAAPAGGWVEVETRNPTMPIAATGEPTVLPTSGYVFPYVLRDVATGNAEADAFRGLSGIDSARVVVHENTSALQLVNRSYNQNPGGPLLPATMAFTVRLFSAAGDASSIVFMGPLGGGASTEIPLAPGLIPGGAQVGYAEVSVAPVTPPPVPPLTQERRFDLVARESIAQIAASARAHEADLTHLAGLVEYGFDVEFGAGPGGNLHDFALLMSNRSANAQTVVVQGIFRRGGQPILTTPRAFGLEAGRTVWMGTSTQESLGLQQNESSIFHDLFGDVFLSQGFEACTLHVQAPRDVDVSARHFDAAFGSFYRIVPSIPRTNRACIYGLPVAASTLSGTRSYVSITNVTNGSLTVPVRAFTPMLGTEYILDPIIVPPRARVDWSPDGLLLREEPTDTVGPRAERLRLEMVPTVGALFDARVERREPSESIIYIRPALVRDN